MSQQLNFKTCCEWHALVNSLPLPALLIRRKNNASTILIEAQNLAFQASLGKAYSDLPSWKALSEALFPDYEYRRWVQKNLHSEIFGTEESSQDANPLPFELHCENGNKKWFQFSISKLNQGYADYFLCILTQVQSPNVQVKTLVQQNTDLLAENQQLKQQQAQLNQVQEMAKIGSWELNVSTNEITWSEQLYKIYREDPKYLKPNLQTFLEKTPEVDRQRVQDFLEEGLKDGRQKRFNCLHQRGDGTIATMDLVGKVLFDEFGMPDKVVGASMDISHLTELQKHNEELAHIMQVARQEIYIIDYHSHQFLFANDKVQEMLGFSEQELLALTVDQVNLALDKHRLADLKQQISVQKKAVITASHLTRSKQTYPVKATLQKIRFQGTQAIVVFNNDLTAIEQAQTAMTEQYRLLENILNHIPVRIFWKDREGRYQGGNSLLVDDAGVNSIEDMIGKTDFELPWAAEDAQKYRDIDLEVMNSGQSNLQFEDRVFLEDGSVRILSLSTVPLHNLKGEIVGILGSYEDITEWRDMELRIQQQAESLSYQANHDALTQLPNRSLLEDRLEHALDKAKFTRLPFAVFFIDLDQFKKVNDSFGHDFGDEVLCQFTARLKKVMAPVDTLARLGGDEFAILMESMQHAKDASLFAQQLVELAKQPFKVRQEEFYLSASVGVSLYPKDAKNKQGLLKCADAAVYRAKDEGRDNFQFYTNDMTLMAFEHLAMQSSLRQGLFKKEFEVYYQPQVDLTNNSLVGMEALVRWQHPQMGTVGPNRFIPIAEETGMIVELDRMTIRNAMVCWVRWYEAGLNPGVLSLNLSVKNLQQPDFIDYVRSTLQQTGCQTYWVEFEVTESDVMRDVELMQNRLYEIQQMGIHISIDDFGTGHSSLAYLKRLPVSKLKIDQSFIRDLPDDEEDSVITRTVIAMTKSLGLKVIAEGVETKPQCDFLLANQCSQVQGYYFSRPICEADMTRFLQEGELKH